MMTVADVINPVGCRLQAFCAFDTQESTSSQKNCFLYIFYYTGFVRICKLTIRFLSILFFPIV